MSAFNSANQVNNTAENKAFLVPGEAE